MLDDDLRNRLKRASDSAEPDAPTTRVSPRALAEAMAEEMARARARRRTMSAAAFLCAAAGVAFVLGRTTAPVQTRIVEGTAPRCASITVASIPVATVEGPARRDFDSRFRIATHEASRLHVDARSPCASTLVLASGDVDVWARGLGGGTLRVEAGAVRVEVVGTRFRVARAGTSVFVHVGEGRVRVEHDRAVTFLGANQSARFDEHVTRMSLPEDVSLALEALTEDARAVTVPTAPEATEQATAATTQEAPRGALPSPATETAQAPEASDALVLEAERAMREGRLDEARVLFRRAGRSQSATGEAAWIRLARLELRAGRAGEARRAIAEHDARFRGGRLAAEALYVDSLAARAAGDEAAAARAEQTLLVRYPESPQAARVSSARAH